MVTCCHGGHVCKLLYIKLFDQPSFNVHLLNIWATIFSTFQVESQRYQSQKEYFERSCYEMEKELKEAIESADTTEKDSK